VDLTTALQDVHAFLGGHDGVAVEIGRTLLELGLFFHLVDMEFREDHAPFGMIGVGQRIESGGPEILLLICSGVMAASSVQDEAPSGSLTRTPPWTALPPLMVTPLAGESLRSAP
jgi:hypothetical protein